MKDVAADQKIDLFESIQNEIEIENERILPKIGKPIDRLSPTNEAEKMRTEDRSSVQLSTR